MTATVQLMTAADFAATIGALLYQHTHAHRLGCVTLGTGLITERNLDTVGGPDVAFWSAERLPMYQMPEVYPDVAADLCVEVLSPGDNPRQVQAKVREYLQHGVRLVWVVDPEWHNMTVYRHAEEGWLLWENATLSGEDVLPGFQCRVGELFE
jgi:Uma2 family endonuclease